MIEDLHKHWQKEVNFETNDRVETSESMLQLLEQTCNRIDRVNKYR